MSSRFHGASIWPLPASASGPRSTTTTAPAHHEVVELEEDEIVAFRREHPGTDATTLARFTLIDVPGGTRLTVVESGFEQLEDPDAVARDHEDRWEAELGELQALLATEGRTDRGLNAERGEQRRRLQPRLRQLLLRAPRAR